MRRPLHNRSGGAHFIELLKTRNGAQSIQLLDEDGVRLEAFDTNAAENTPELISPPRR